MVICNSMDMGLYRKISTCSSTASFHLKSTPDVLTNDDSVSSAAYAITFFKFLQQLKF